MQYSKIFTVMLIGTALFGAGCQVIGNDRSEPTRGRSDQGASLKSDEFNEQEYFEAEEEGYDDEGLREREREVEGLEDQIIDDENPSL